MLQPYVQDVNRWIDYYKKGINGPLQSRDLTNAHPTPAPNKGSLSETADITVSSVEPKGPLPPVPSTGPSPAMKTISPSEAAVQQAAFNVKRQKLAASAPSSKKKRTKQMATV